MIQLSMDIKMIVIYFPKEILRMKYAIIYSMYQLKMENTFLNFVSHF